MSDVAINCIVIDTINAIQNNQYMSLLDTTTMISRDKWKDFGVDIYAFMEYLKSNGFENVLILGYEGTGKSFGSKFLNPEDTIIFNVDNKDLTFRNTEYDGVTKRARESYGTVTNPTRNMKIPKDYKNITNVIDHLIANNMLSTTEKPVCFILGHIEDYKTDNGEVRQRLKTLGGLASKMNIEGSVTNCFYSKLNVMGDTVEFKLDTMNTGFNTGRSLEDLFEGEGRYIDNNFEKIRKAIVNY